MTAAGGKALAWRPVAPLAPVADGMRMSLEEREDLEVVERARTDAPRCSRRASWMQATRRVLEGNGRFG